jgi:mannitol/fructose-specific phosphotransferase system IIA component (Ntr-type)
LLAADKKKEHLRAFEELFCILENEKLYDALLQISDYDSLNKVLKEVDVDE